MLVPWKKGVRPRIPRFKLIDCYNPFLDGPPRFGKRSAVREMVVNPRWPMNGELGAF